MIGQPGLELICLVDAFIAGSDREFEINPFNPTEVIGLTEGPTFPMEHATEYAI